MARKQALKVFRTPIGFHDAYVAAPSQKAALAAWGSSADLFARGVAERVTNEALMREPLASPGKIVRRLREGDADALAEGDTPKRKKPAGKTKAKPPAKRRPDPGPRPSRADLASAEEALDQLRSQQEHEEADLRDREKAIERERRDLDRSHQRDLAAAEATVEQARRDHSAALDRWLARQE